MVNLVLLVLQVQGMAGRWGPNLQEAEVQILQLMNNRDANRDNARKKHLRAQIKSCLKAIGPNLSNICQIGHGETKMVKVGDITIETMISRGSKVIIIIGDN